MKKSLIVAVLSLLPLCANAQKAASLVVTATTKYQHIDGFGGTGMNGQWADVYTEEKAKKLWGNGEGQVGLNIMRVRINPNESNWGEYGNTIKWARKYGTVTVFATPWTPPKKYKTSKTYNYQNDFGTTVWPIVEHSWGGQGSNGGAINPDCIEEYAAFLEKYRKTMANKGCPIDIISIQNESDYTPTATDDGVEHASYESCIFSPTEMAAMVKAARAAVNTECKIMGPECFGWGQHNYNNKLASLPDAVDNIDIWGNHLYGTNEWSFVRNVTNKTKKHMWQTEFYVDFNNTSDGSFAGEYNMINSLEKAISSGYSAYVYYNMLDDFFACKHGGSATQLWKRAYVFSHYAKCATGQTLIKSTLSDTSGKLTAGSTYISDTGDTVTVMICNPSTYTYTFAVTKLPFIPNKIIQTATNDNVNALRSDVSAKYVTGTKSIKTTLQPKTFYTFQFILKEESEEPEEFVADKAYKTSANGNPIDATHFMAEPTAIEHNGRFYVYATNDQQEFEYSDGIVSNGEANIKSLRCLSTADMVNWIDHGTINVTSIATWAKTSTAPSIVSRLEEDGQTHFYLYFASKTNAIGVLTATSPTGPWTDPLGKALITTTTDGLGSISSLTDPGVAINEETGEAYMAFGGGAVKGTDLMPGNARIVKLGSDMISLGSEIKTISAPCHLDGNELNYLNGTWFYTYCTRESIASDWKTYSSTTAPAAQSIVQMKSTDPLADDWTYAGQLLANPGTAGDAFPTSTNHTHIQKFRDNYYVLFHTQWLENQRGLSGGYRAIHMGRATFNNSKQQFVIGSSVLGSLTGVTQVIANRPDAFQEQTAELAALRTKNWWVVRGVNFTTDSLAAKTIAVVVKGKGQLRVQTTLSGAPIATINFDTEDWIQVSELLTDEISTVKAYIYFVLESYKDAEVASWRFSPSEETGIKTISAEELQTKNSLFPYTYDLSGRRVEEKGNLPRGIYINNGHKIVK